MADDAQAQANARMYSRADVVAEYDRRDLRAVEVTILLRHRDALKGRVLDVGCGAGRLTGHLLELADEVYAIDASPAMVNACVARYPAAHVEVGDVRDLSRYDSDQFDAIVAGFNLIDVLNDDERRDVLGEFRRLLAPGGVLVFSTHNRDAPLDRPVDWLRFGPIAVAKLIRNAPRWLPNRRRLRRHEREEATYAIRNDSAHDFGALHYYIARADQERQLAGAGFELIECLDLAGEPVPPNTRSTVAELHYVAR